MCNYMKGKTSMDDCNKECITKCKNKCNTIKKDDTKLQCMLVFSAVIICIIVYVNICIEKT